MFKIGDKVRRTTMNQWWENTCQDFGRNTTDIFVVKSAHSNRTFELCGMPNRKCDSDNFELYVAKYSPEDVLRAYAATYDLANTLESCVYVVQSTLDLQEIMDSDDYKQYLKLKDRFAYVDMLQTQLTKAE